MPDFFAARITLTAISPLLAISILLKCFNIQVQGFKFNDLHAMIYMYFFCEN